jgi:hypothetical protein
MRKMSTGSIKARNSSAPTKSNGKAANQFPHASVKQSLDSAAATARTAGPIERDLLRYERLQRRVDAAPGDKLFLPDRSPVSPRNRQRFTKYFEMMKSLTMLKIKLIHEFMRVHGVDPSYPQEMWAIGEVVRGIGAAAGPAVAPSPEFASDHSSIRRQPIQTYSEEVLRLAEYLKRNALSMKQPFKMESYKTTTDREKGQGGTRPN